MNRTAILSLTLSHFRSYRAARIGAEGETVALYGPNGAGKTNVLEAVSMLSPGRGLRRAGAEDLIRAPEAIGWKVSAELDTPAGTVDMVTAVEGADGARRIVTIDGKTAPQTALSRHLRMIWLTPAMDRLWTEGAGDRRRFLDRITMGFVPEHGDTSLAYEKAMRERNRLLKDGVTDDAWFGGLEAQLARTGARIARARAEALARLNAVQAETSGSSAFPRADLAIRGEMEARFAQLLANDAGEDDLHLAESGEAADLSRRLTASRARDAAAGRTLEGPHRSDLEAVYAAKAMPARACSTGEQKALLISLCLANARALTEAAGQTPVLLLDEIAAHLDNDRRRALYAELHALGCQAWMTGTGPELFDGLDARRLIVSECQGQSVLEET